MLMDLFGDIKMQNRVCIIGSGNSLQCGLNKGIQKLLKNEITFTLNEEFRFFDSTVEIFGDWTFYKCRYDLLKNHPMIVGRWDFHIGTENRETKELYCEKLPQLILLPSCSKYLGQDSWKKGFYSGVLCGLFTLTLVIALGFDEIFILGFDGKMINGKTHHYEGLEGFGNFVNEEGQPRTGVGLKKGVYNTSVFNRKPKDFNQNYWDKYKDELKKIKIYNVSPESKITTFPKINYDEFISIIKNNPSNINQTKIRQEIRTYIKNHAKFNNHYFNC